jgi:large subunit ribosomal protein L19e
MKLDKKQLVARTFNVGVGRIVFNKERLGDIKEAITKQDIRDLVADKAIFILEVGGRRKIEKRTSRRRAGSVRKRVKNSKQDYVKFIRGLRAYLKELKKQKIIDAKQFLFLRNNLRSRKIQNKTQLKEYIAQLKKQ